MESPQAENLLLKKKYDLHKSPEVENAAKRIRMRTGEKVPQDPSARIQNYLDRLSNIVNPPQLKGHPGFDRKERNLKMLKNGLYDQFIIKPDEISDNYWENQRRIIRERGQGGDLERADWNELRKQNTEAIIADQKSSLNKWINYLSSSDAPYSDPLKYFTVRSVLYMGEYDKEKKMYPQRSKATTKPFPDLNREALAYVLDAVEKKYQGQHHDNPEFEKLLAGENFAKLYAWAIEKVTPESAGQLVNVNGQWIKYQQGSDHMPLVQSLQGHGTGWCTAGESTAEIQLKGGDFYVYYSFDNDGKPTIPRAAIRMDGNNIGEVRGIAKEQNLDPYIDDVVEKKLKEFPDGELHKKKVNDMRLLTSLDNKTRLGQSLTAEDLVFLYEINVSIDGFGYQKDPRIAELRSQRDPQEDMPIIFGCDNSQIARSIKEINKDTKAYLGALAPGIFDAIRKYDIEHVYTSFPEGKILRESMEIGGKSVIQLEQELKQANINVSDYAKDMLHSKDFTTLPNPETLDTVRLKVSDLGLSENPTTDQVYAKAKELGLELVPAEAGVHYRLKNRDQELYDYLYMGMKQIAGRHGGPNVFELRRFGDGLWLNDGWAEPDDGWDPKDEFMFALGKSEPKKLGLLDSLLKR
ncbi:MAG: hypothetical protein HW400_303 [Candidatus Levybacteria bacterium]|nr:hypothetical protein [Candidatus Levybacteria bacterium]